MKKILTTGIATIGLALGAYAQGTISFNSPANSGVSLNTAANYYGGGTLVTLTLYSLNGSVDSAINADNGVNSGAAIGLLGTDSFVQQFQGSVTMGSGNAGSYGNFGTITLNTVPLHGSSATVAIEAETTIAGVLYGGVINFTTAVGDPLATPIAGTPFALGTSWDAITPQNDPVDSAYNLIMTPVPEPTTLALAGLGGAALVAFRRRKA